MSATAGREGVGEFLRRFWRDDRGATAIEYAMIAVGIACAIAATVKAVGSSLNTNFYSKVNDAVRN